MALKIDDFVVPGRSEPPEFSNYCFAKSVGVAGHRRRDERKRYGLQERWKQKTGGKFEIESTETVQPPASKTRNRQTASSVLGQQQLLVLC